MREPHQICIVGGIVHHRRMIKVELGQKWP
jgi:hypothetical protein